MTLPTKILDSMIGLKLTARIGIHEWKGEMRNHVEWFTDVPREFLGILVANFQGWADDNPCPGTGKDEPVINDWVFDAAKACKRVSLPPEVALNLITDMMTRRPHSHEVEKAINNAYGYRPASAVERSPAVEPYDEQRLIEVAERCTEDITYDRLREISPEPAYDATTVYFLNAITRPGEAMALVQAVGTKDDGKPIWPRGGHVWRHGGTEVPPVTSIYHKRHGAWFVSNPIDPDTGRWRDEDLRVWRYGVMESDKAPEDLWLRMLVQQPLNIVAIYTSGGRSIHCLYRIDAASPEEFKRVILANKAKYVPLGADPACFKAAQLTRLPGYYRAEKKNWQSLLYLSPEADGSPIYAP